MGFWALAWRLGLVGWELYSTQCIVWRYERCIIRDERSDLYTGIEYLVEAYLPADLHCHERDRLARKRSDLRFCASMPHRDFTLRHLLRSRRQGIQTQRQGALTSMTRVRIKLLELVLSVPSNCRADGDTERLLWYARSCAKSKLGKGFHCHLSCEWDSHVCGELENLPFPKLTFFSPRQHITQNIIFHTRHQQFHHHSLISSLETSNLLTHHGFLRLPDREGHSQRE